MMNKAIDEFGGILEQRSHYLIPQESVRIIQKILVQHGTQAIE